MEIYKILNSSIGKKMLMAVSGIFLMIFLAGHLFFNIFIFYGKDAFNNASHFMGENTGINILQYLLAIGFIVHIFLGIQLHLQNKAASGNRNYALNKWEAHTSFNSRPMMYTGVFILFFLILHLKNFTLPLKNGHMNVLTDYDLVEIHLINPFFTSIYIGVFILLFFHLSHGFKSVFQSIGVHNKCYTPAIRKLGTFYIWVIFLGFSAIPIWFYLQIT